MSSGIIDIIKKVALNAFEASNPVKLLFGKVVSINPVKIQVGELLTLTKEFLVINGTVSVGDNVTLIRCQGGQKYVVLGSRTVYVEKTVYVGGGEVDAESGTWQFPFTDGYTMTSKFGEYRSGGKRHKGVDLVGKGSKHIYPINNGTVVHMGNDPSGYGNYVVIKHNNEYWSLYAHMRQIYVKQGQTVNKSTMLGVEGSTGHSTGSHLHLEVRKGGNSSSNTIDPMAFLNNE
jgi:murein DD-endopeptidase MepM/ murein hydrolase activator NlpD